MTYIRKELYFIKDFDFSISDPKRKASASASPPILQNKFLIVLHVENHDMGIYCLTGSLRGEITSLFVSKLVDECNAIDAGHFYKFDNTNICDAFSFDVQTYLVGHPGNVFEESIVTLYQLYNIKGKAVKKGILKDEIFISILKCLKESDYLEGNLIIKLQKIYDEETKPLPTKKKK
jgi:hypothetical protein